MRTGLAGSWRLPRPQGVSKCNRIAFLYCEWDVHGGPVGYPLSNDCYRGWNSQSVADAIAQLFAHSKENTVLVRFLGF